MSAEEQDLDLRSLTGALRRYGGRIALVSVAAGLLGYTLASNASKEFSASAIVEIVDPTQDVVSAGAKSGFDIDVQRQAVEVLLESPQVRAAVAAELGVAVEAVAPIDAEGAAGSALIGVRGVANTGADAQRTADLAVALATEVQRQRLATEFQAVADKLKEDSAGLDDRIRELEGRIQSLDQAAAQAGIAAVVAQGQVATPAQIESGLVSKQQADEAAVARQQLATVFEQQLALEREAQQYELEATVRSPGFRPYRDAGLPKSSGPRPKQAAALAAAAGFVLAMGAAYVMAYADGRVRRSTNVEAARMGMDLLATLPAAPSASARFGLAAADERSRVVVASRQSLALTLRYRKPGDDPVVVGVVGPKRADRGGELVMDLAVTLARSGLDVVAVDADLRRSVASDAPGLAAVLAGDIELEDALCDLSTGGSGALALLPAGGGVSDPVGLVGTAAVGHVIYELRRQADCVIIEFPPALEAAETLALAQHVDDVVLTGAVGTTSRHDLEVVKRRLDAVGAHLLGLVLIESGGGRRAKRRAKAKARTSKDVRVPADRQASATELEPDQIETAMEAVADPDVGLTRRVGPTR